MLRRRNVTVPAPAPPPPVGATPARDASYIALFAPVNGSAPWVIGASAPRVMLAVFLSMKSAMACRCSCGEVVAMHECEQGGGWDSITNYTLPTCGEVVSACTVVGFRV